jgi:protein-S-isoprenylcysteine O-methyltransferase Ste14
MNKPKIHAGGVFGVILLASIAIDLVLRVWVKPDILKMTFLRANGVVLLTSVCIGVVLLVLGGVVGYISHEAFNRAVEKDGRVITILQEGPFRWVRHPFYLSLLLIVLSFALLLYSYVLLVGLIVLTIILVREAIREEAILIETFGETYSDYQRKTGMFLPVRFRR